MPRPSVGRPGRYVFLTLLLLALGAPAGMVLAGETAERYVVVFDDAAVRAADTEQRAAFGGLLTPNPVAQRAMEASEAWSIDAETVVRRVRQLEARTGMRNVADVYTSAVGGFSADLTPSQVRAISSDPSVSTILRDEAVSLEPGIAGEAAGGVRTTANPSTRVPPGVRRVGARNSSVMGLTARGRTVNADVAIIDTGVDRDHRDLNVVGGFNCTGRNRNGWDDTNGHGTHVAGIVGALDNSFGVTGVAPGARIWSVKVLDRQGHGFLSWVVCGVDWVTAQRDRGGRALIEVANMSLTFTLPGANDANCGTGRDSLHQAICRSIEKGTVYVAAAGNESRNARRYRPAAYDEVITVSAMADYDGRGGGRGGGSCPYWTPESDDSFASFSNYGADVDLIAPGRCVLSTYLKGRYAWMSGTSMATPHVSGAAALYRALFPHATPQQTRLALQAVGRLDWRTGTDRDPNHEKAVWIGEFRTVPDFGLSARLNAATVSPGSNAQLDLTLSRVGGFDTPIRVALTAAPRGIAARPIVVRARAASLTVDVARSVRPGRYTVEVTASAAGVEHSASITVVVRAAAPQASFTSPRGDTSVQADPRVGVAWDERGAAVPERRLERQSARIESPGTCDGVRWQSDGVRSVSGFVTDTVRPGRCYRWRLTLSDSSGQRSTAESSPVLVDTSAPRAPSVTLTAQRERAVDLDRLGVDQAYIGHSGTLWVRGGVSGTVIVNVDAFDPESGISANRAEVTDERGWRPEWIGTSANGNLRLHYGPRGGDAALHISSVNAAGLAGAATVGRLMRDTDDPDPVRWTSVPHDSTRRISATTFRLDWAGGNDDGSGAAAQHVVGRYRAGLTRDGQCRTNGFTADGYFRLLGNRTLETGLEPGRCYVWSVRTLDNVGNSSASVISGYVIVEPRR